MEKERGILEEWCREQRITDYGVIEEKLTFGRISGGQVDRLLSGIHPGDIIVTSSLTRLGRSINMLQKALQTLYERKAALVTADNGRRYGPEDIRGLIEQLKVVTHLSTSIKAERNAEAGEKPAASATAYIRENRRTTSRIISPARKGQ